MPYFRPMSSRAPTAPDVPDPWLEDAIARAERGRDQLQRLAEIGTEVAEALRKRADQSPHDPKTRHDPRKDFERASRGVALTLKQLAKMEAHIVALRNSAGPSRPALSPDAARANPIDRKILDAFLALTPPADRRDLH